MDLPATVFSCPPSLGESSHLFLDGGLVCVFVLCLCIHPIIASLVHTSETFPDDGLIVVTSG